MALKKGLPELRFTGWIGAANPTPIYAVTPDEIDRYEVITIDAPASPTGIAPTWVGTQKSGTADTAKALTLLNVIPDWPRSLEFAIAGSSVGMAGTTTVVGVDQFGSPISETMGFGSADNGGTVAGTRVFAQITSVTTNYGTFAGANGTLRVGLGTAGTTALFGLPFKVGGTTDLKILSFTAGTGAVSINGGTIAAFIDVPTSSIKAPFNIVGTTSMTAWVRPTANTESISLVANLKQRT